MYKREDGPRQNGQEYLVHRLIAYQLSFCLFKNNWLNLGPHVFICFISVLNLSFPAIFTLWFLPMMLLQVSTIVFNNMMCLFTFSKV